MHTRKMSMHLKKGIEVAPTPFFSLGNHQRTENRHGQCIELVITKRLPKSNIVHPSSIFL